jgi:hypothetical protein
LFTTAGDVCRKKEVPLKASPWARGQLARIFLSPPRNSPQPPSIESFYKKTATFCKKWSANWICLLHFMENSAVEPTNNAAERSLLAKTFYKKMLF